MYTVPRCIVCSVTGRATAYANFEGQEGLLEVGACLSIALARSLSCQQPRLPALPCASICLPARAAALWRSNKHRARRRWMDEHRRLSLRRLQKCRRGRVGYFFGVDLGSHDLCHGGCGCGGGTFLGAARSFAAPQTKKPASIATNLQKHSNNNARRPGCSARSVDLLTRRFKKAGPHNLGRERAGFLWQWR